ncbi:MAG TPA: ribulose-phosphate 3-epimerase [Candidatus Dormibacteraeota bacterium]|jgi:ribulose-phosphate 3-epimerase|nr:ribulose-phosphate 3-epimerase [Candidatus Dormibacteraeota bacterium]
MSLSPQGIIPSILSADLTRLGEQVQEAVEAGADRIQVDVMDGHFVPNLTFGADTIAAVRRVAPAIPIEAHLMIEQPERQIESFARAGASHLFIQVESTTSLYRTVTAIRKLGCSPGVALNPGTPVEAVRELLPYIDLILVMTVEPGFGGQSFIPSSPDKVARVRAMAPELDVEVDGGIEAQTAATVAEAGANLFVAGSAVYAHREGIASGIGTLRQAVAPYAR